jgi:2-octaprenylphenol hydroxylase
MNETASPAVVIVGGGMAGGLLACLLAAADVPVTVLDAGPPPQSPEGDADLRVSAINMASRQLLAACDVWQKLDDQRIAPYTRMEVQDSDGAGQLVFTAADAGASDLGWIIENSNTVAALWARACELGVDWRCQTPVTDIRRGAHGWLVVPAAGDAIEASLLVGADGARSRVRAAAGIPAPVRDTGHRAIVASVGTSRAHEGCARQWFLPTGPVALLPLFGDGCHSSLVWSTTPAESERLMNLPADEFAAALAVASEHQLGDVVLASERQVFPIMNLHASDYVRDGLALIGDAAHVVHPLAGQGINLGMLDAGLLAEELLRARRRGPGLAHVSALKRYQRRRRGHNALMQASFIGLKGLFEHDQLPIRWLRNTGMRLVNDTPFVKKRFARAALGVEGDLPEAARQRTLA